MNPNPDPTSADHAWKGDPGDRPTAASPGVVGTPTSVRIAGYRILALLGSGGMGLVYEAEQEALRRRVALKVMKPGLVRPDLLARFESEGRMLARLRHAGIAGVIDAGIHRDEHGLSVPYLVMELVEASTTLERYLREHRPAANEVVALVLLVCDAIAAAHDAGIVHRDLKPSNILVTPAWSGGRVGVKLIDFGIAKVLGESLAGAIDSPVTATGVVIGTPEYMAPEQILGQPADHRVDIFAIGAVLFEMLTGRSPHEIRDRGDRESLRHAICERDATRVRSLAPGVPLDLDVIVAKCLRRDAADRYQSVPELAADLRAFAEGRPIAARPESMRERATRRTAELTARRPMLAALVVALASAMIGSLVLTPLVFRHTGASIVFNGAMASVAPATTLAGDLPDTRIIAITDTTDMQQVGAAAGIAEVSNEARASWRRVYADLVRRLTAAGVRGIGIDLLFRRASEHDQALSEALDAARRAGIPVVLAAPSWTPGDDGTPSLALDLAKRASSGPVTGGFTGPDTWALDLVLMRAGSEPTPSLSLRLAALARAPSAALSLADAGLLEVRFLRDDARRAPLREPIYLRVSGEQSITEDDAALGLRSGDRVLQLLVPLDRARLLDATTPVERVMAMSPDAIRERFAGQIVLLGNASADGGDMQEPPGGEPMPGVWSHAAGVQRLLRDDAMQVPSERTMHGLIALLALTGAWFGLATRRVLWFAAALTVLPFAGSVLSLRVGGLLWNPLAAIGAGLLALVVGWGLGKLASRRRMGSAPLSGGRLA
jgi:serine/threonine protein kinase/CHASE2 domain-containing sensor protein